MAKPSKLAHVVYMTRRFDEMLDWYKAVFEAECNIRTPHSPFSPMTTSTIVSLSPT